MLCIGFKASLVIRGFHKVKQLVLLYIYIILVDKSYLDMITTNRFVWSLIKVIYCLEVGVQFCEQIIIVLIYH